MPRILIAECIHEVCSFNPVRTCYDDFFVRTGQTMFDSYHCSRQNTNTGRLTTAMFEGVLVDIAGMLGKPERR